jgi:RNA polymerase sigma-70 factor (ECF subfamily)
VTNDDGEARFTALFRLYYPAILTTCIRRLGDRGAAEDAAQEVFRIAWQRFDREDPNLPWLYAITRNVVGNAYRRAARGQDGSVRAEESSEGADDADAMDLRSAMKSLRRADRELLYMTYWEDLTAPEIAAILGISVPAVWVRTTRARDALRRVLASMLPAGQGATDG